MIVPSAQAMLDFARPGDTIVVWRLDRLGRSLKHLIETVMGLQARGRDQLSESDRACGYINTGREVYLPSLWGTCRDGARCDPAADQGWTRSCSCARAH